jgi:exodeoxyribonuclease-1
VRFKLDLIAPLNGFAAHNAHDALGDVEATIHIARQIAQRAPALWAELLANRDKVHVQARIEAFQPMALIERFGGGSPRATLGCFCGYSASNPNQAAFFDLEAADPADLLSSDDAALFAAVDATPKIIRSLSVNKTPALLSLPMPTELQLRRAEVIANAPEFRARVAQALAARFQEDPAAPTPMVEKQIFGGFYSNADKALLAEFQRADWPRRQEIAATLSDPRLRQLGRRLVAFHAPHLFSPEEWAQYVVWLRERWSAPDAPETEWMTADKAQRALDEIRGKEGLDASLVAEIAAYLQGFDIIAS